MLGYVQRRLREEGAKAWPEIALEAQKPLTTIRKIAYNNRRNPRLDTIEPLAECLRKRERLQ